MKNALITFTLACLTLSCAESVEVPQTKDVKSLAHKVADWQIEHFEDQASYRAPRDGKTTRDNKKYHDLQWQNAAFFSGLYEFSTIQNDPKYIDWLNQMAKDHNFKLHQRKFHADDHAVGQTYLKLYDYYKKGHLMNQVKSQFDQILQDPNKDKWHWWWCDALFMSPPVWAKLARITGDEQYLTYMDEQYHMTYDSLWCADESLFFRDLGYLNKQEKNGEKVFWSRGNGWVFGGLALMIPDLPQAWDGRDFYVDLYQTMAVRVKELQREDGTWSAGLLGSVDDYQAIETSGTSFFTFGLAWGVNNGYLDRATYEPVIFKAWDALKEAVNEEGMLTYVQGVGAKPAPSSSEYTEVYGSGAFLAACSEVYQYLQKFYDPQSAQTKAEDQQYPVFMKDGGWCWYQGPRAIINKGKLLIGGIDGQEGNVAVSVVDLASEKIDGQVILDEGFQCDDHNAPVFYTRSDGSILTMWASHGSDKIHRYKISSTSDYLHWSDKKEHYHTYEAPQGVTYMNLYSLKNENKLFCFFRDGPHFNPAYITSEDQGATWSKDTHLIANKVKGRQRPYTVYNQLDDNTVGIVYTDAHPRDYGNSLYYVEFDGSQFKDVQGNPIHQLSQGPLPTTKGEKIYKGSETSHKPKMYESVPGASWNSNLVNDTHGNPHIAYTHYIDNNDHRYRLCSWNGEQWIDREIAYAGHALYFWESSYTGLITIDPTDPEMIYISSDVNPSTGEYTGGVHEIYAARVSEKDDIHTITWEPVTSGSNYRNIRPVIVAKEGYKVLLWLNGDYKTYLNYDVDVRGKILARP